jgi:hypothetical protein
VALHYFKAFKPEDTDYSGNQTDDEVDKMKCAEMKHIPPKRKVEHSTQEDKRSGQDPPKRRIA